MYACVRGDEAMVQMLLDAGADINSQVQRRKAAVRLSASHGPHPFVSIKPFFFVFFAVLFLRLHALRPPPVSFTTTSPFNLASGRPAAAALWLRLRAGVFPPRQ